MRPSLLVFLAGLALFAATPNSARSQWPPSGASPIVGSGSFGAAPRVTPGTQYADSIRPNELLYYAVKLEPGQTAQILLDIADTGTIISVKAYDTLRRLLPNTVELATTGGELVTRTPVAETLNVASEDGADASGPGYWYFEVVAYNPRATSDRYEVPFTLQVDVAGEPVATPTPTPTPAIPESASGEPEAGGKPSVALVGGVAGAGLLLGGLGAARIKRR